jgi:hypothetical protein
MAAQRYTIVSTGIRDLLVALMRANFDGTQRKHARATASTHGHAAQRLD